MEMAGYSPGALVTILLLAIGHRGSGRCGEREGAVVGLVVGSKQATWECWQQNACGKRSGHVT